MLRIRAHEIPADCHFRFYFFYQLTDSNHTFLCIHICRVYEDVEIRENQKHVNTSVPSSTVYFLTLFLFY